MDRQLHNTAKASAEKGKKAASLREELVMALAAAKIPSPRLEAGIILRYAVPGYPEMTATEAAQARQMLARRLRHEPLDKITGEREFYKSVFMVNNAVLTPRPDTEILVEEALKRINPEKKCRILDLGTGSGCILLSLLKECPLAEGTGVDVSPGALAVARENAARLGVSGRCSFVNQSWSDWKPENEKWDMIVSNPPYIPRSDIAGLDAEVKDYDPHLALDGGEDGYGCYREIAGLVSLIMQKGGYILLESGMGQAEDIKRIFSAQGLETVAVIPDLAGINRCVILKK